MWRWKDESAGFSVCEPGNMTAFTADATLTLSSQYGVTHMQTQRGLEVLIFDCEGGANDLSHMMRVTAVRNQNGLHTVG